MAIISPLGIDNDNGPYTTRLSDVLPYPTLRFCALSILLVNPISYTSEKRFFLNTTYTTMGTPIRAVTEFMGIVVFIPGSWEMVSEKSITKLPSIIVTGIRMA
jgi:hypothetical protein